MNESVRLIQLFGANIVHGVNETLPSPIAVSAYDALQIYEQEGDEEAYAEIVRSAQDVANFVIINTETDCSAVETLTMLFTESQLQTMKSRLVEYLGTDVTVFIQSPVAPTGYPTYIERLGTYFSGGDSLVTSQFSSFYERHVNPAPGASGPLEANSRTYAVEALRILERQLSEHYQVPFRHERVGPYIERQGVLYDWAPGVAECQFLILDAIRDFVSSDNSTAYTPQETTQMTVPDIGNNLRDLLVNRKTIVAQVHGVNPDIAASLDFAIDGLSEHVEEVFHRGRPGSLRYIKQPENARRAILRVEALLLEAQRQSDTEVNQEEVPILDL